MGDADLAIQLALWILVLPLIAFVIQVWIGKFLPREGDWLPTSAMFVAFVLSMVLFCGWFWTDALNPAEKGEVIDRDLVHFFSMGEMSKQRDVQAELNQDKATFYLAFGIRLDNLTLIMLVVVTLVSFLVHLYSCGYMRDHHGNPEERYNRFFAYLALFSFSMLGCVLANSLMFTFIFWELVGVCSYFLIGFYFQKKSAANACIKAFMTTRVGDLGFFLALMVILHVVGSTHYNEIFASVQTGQWNGLTMLGLPLLAVCGVALFFGPVGKSAQFPLHVWLPDAMEGPTPVSALIHAATMVAAGVYLMARMFPFIAGDGFFTGSDYITQSIPLYVIALIGGFTALLAATIALPQTDLKKVLAYSTISQLGYMMLGIGTGSLAAGMFHLWTHAFFKGQLFLGSGSVIHAVNSNEMSDMGGLRKKMPITFITMMAATLAIAGFPILFAGFVSKDGILAGAMAYGAHNGDMLSMLPFIFGMIAAVLTPFYMFRMMFLTFFGKPKDQHRYDHAHESPWTMALPLVVLGLLSTGLAAGYTGQWFTERLDPAALGYRAEAQDIRKHAMAAGTEDAALAAGGESKHKGEQAWVAEKHHLHLTVAGLSILAMLLGIFGAHYVFMKNRDKDFVGETGFLAGYKKVLLELYYIDWFYAKFVLGGLFLLKSIVGLFDKYFIDTLVNLAGWTTKGISYLSGWVDYNGVDGAVRGTASITMAAGSEMRGLQTGKLQDYLYLTVILLVAIFMLWATVLLFS